MKKVQKRALTLVEIMIVIFIIGIIGSVVGVNMKGSLEEGKAFKTKEGARQIYDVLTLEFAKGNVDTDKLQGDLKTILERSGMVRSPKELVKDGWGHEYEVEYHKAANDFTIKSKNYVKYAKKKSIEIEEFMGGEKD